LDSGAIPRRFACAFLAYGRRARAHGAISRGSLVKTLLSVTVNGLPREEAVADTTLLIEFLRDGLGLTGTKMGCDLNRSSTNQASK
jgi:hypothetical protein